MGESGYVKFTLNVQKIMYGNLVTAETHGVHIKHVKVERVFCRIGYRTEMTPDYLYAFI